MYIFSKLPGKILRHIIATTAKIKSKIPTNENLKFGLILRKGATSSLVGFLLPKFFVYLNLSDHRPRGLVSGITSVVGPKKWCPGSQSHTECLSWAVTWVQSVLNLEASGKKIVRRPKEEVNLRAVGCWGPWGGKGLRNVQSHTPAPQLWSLLSPRGLKGASQVVLMVKNPPVNIGDTEDLGLIPGLGRSPGVRNGNSV